LLSPYFTTFAPKHIFVHDVAG